MIRPPDPEQTTFELADWQKDVARAWNVGEARYDVAMRPSDSQAHQQAVERLARLEPGSQPVETSEAAADRTRGTVQRQRLRVLRALARASVKTGAQLGSTADEISELFGETHNRVAPRLTDLLNMGFAERLDGKDGRQLLKRPTRTGSSAFAHVISASGFELLRSIDGRPGDSR
jgi:DNA-binding MarR family transcriptional regulator